MLEQLIVPVVLIVVFYGMYFVGEALKEKNRKIRQLEDELREKE